MNRRVIRRSGSVSVLLLISSVRSWPLVFICLSLIPALAVAQAPEFMWASGAGGIGSDSGRGIAVDRNGDCYVTGWFSGTATFGSKRLTSVGQFDIFVAKYDGAGSLLWVRQAGGGTYNEGDAIAFDSGDNCYVTGYFTGIANFGTTMLSTTQRTRGYVRGEIRFWGKSALG